MHRALSRFGWTGLTLVVASVLAACGAQTPAAPQGGDAAPAAPVAAGSELKVAVVPGGPHPYFAPMEGAIADAKRDFGLAEGVFKAPTEWKLDAQNTLLNTLAAQGYNAFAIFPGDANGTNGTIDELVGKGFPVIAVAGCVNEPTKATFCLATDVAESAYLGTKALIEAMGGKGKIVHGTGFLVDPNTQLRIEAVEKAVAETNGQVELMQTLADIDSQEAADKAINSFLAANAASVDGVITTAYVPSTVFATALKNIGDKRIKMVGIDDDPIMLGAITEGFASGTMAQNPYGQAYLGAEVLQWLNTGCTKKADAPFKIDSGTLLISAQNIESYKDELKALTKTLGEGFKAQYLTCAA